MKELNELFDFKDYKQYLRSRVGAAGSRTGVKGAMAKALRCQPTYVSQVVNGEAHFSLEQGEIFGRLFWPAV